MEYNFDRVHQTYDATRGLPPGVAERICRWVLARLPADPQITEIGVGTGRIALPFIESNIRYTGIDISEQMTARLLEKLKGDLRRAQVLLGDITEPLPVELGSQDAVIAVHILHLVDGAQAVRQVRQALKPHGALIWGYQLHDELSVRYRIRAKLKEQVSGLGGGGGRDFFAPEARALLAQMGARESRHVVTVWTETATCGEELEQLRQRVHSFTWSMEDDVLQAAVRRAEAWARSEYGDLDRPHTLEQRFVIDWYQF